MRAFDVFSTIDAVVNVSGVVDAADIEVQVFDVVDSPGIRDDATVIAAVTTGVVVVVIVFVVAAVVGKVIFVINRQMPT